MVKYDESYSITSFLETTNNESFVALQEKSKPMSTDGLDDGLDKLLTGIEGETESETNEVKKVRLEYIQTQFNILRADPEFVASMHTLVKLIQESHSETFLSFIENELTLPENDKALSAYALLENILYPNFHGDHEHLIRASNENKIPLRSLIPPHLSECDDVLKHIKNSPNSNFLGPLLAYGIGFAPSVLGSIVAARLLGVPSFYRLLVAISPTALGGLGRLIVADQTTRGRGKETVMLLLGSSTVGLLAIFALIESVKLDEVKVNSFSYLSLFFANVISGLGISSFSAISLALQSAPDESLDHYAERLNMLVGSEPTRMDKFLGRMSRAPSKKATSAIAGLGNLTPPLTLYSTALISCIDLNGFYGLISGITLVGMITSYFLLQNSYLDQLRQQKIPEDLARYMAAQLGQKNFLSNDLQSSFLKKFKNLTQQEKLEIGRAVVNYVVSFGLLLAVASTGNSTFSQRGVPDELVSIYTGSIITVSSLVRTFFSSEIFSKNPIISTNISFIGMASTAAIFASLPLDPNMILVVMMLFSIFNGMANRSVFDEIGYNIPRKMGEATSLAGGLGAWSAFGTSLLFAFVSNTNVYNGITRNDVKQTNTSNEYFVITALCCMSLILNAVYEYSLKPKMKPTEDSLLHTIQGSSPLEIKDSLKLRFFSEKSNTEDVVDRKKQAEAARVPTKLDEEECNRNRQLKVC